MGKPEVRDPEVRDGVATLAIGDTLLVLWKEPASLDRWNFQLNRMETMILSRSGGIICCDLILDGSSPPGPAVRTKMQADFRRLGGKLRRLVVVPLGDSLWLSVVRTIVRGVLLLSGQSERQRVAASVRDGIQELLAVAGPETPSMGEMTAGVKQLFVALGLEPTEYKAA